MSSSSEELDFDDPRFILEAETTTAQQPLTYAEKRRKTVGRGRERAELEGRGRTQKQREEESREEGLRRNLLSVEKEKEASGEGQSKAMKMMRGMGFTPGESLGRKRSRSPPPMFPGSADLSTSSSARGLGFGSSASTSGTATPLDTAETPPPAQKPRTEPLTFSLRDRRTGLGVPQASSRPRPFPSHLLPQSSGSSAPAFNEAELATYLDSVKSSLDLRKAGGYYRSLRRTCEELDRRRGMESSVMWRDEEEEQREEGRKVRRRAFLREEEEEDEVLLKGAVDDKSGRSKSGGLAYERGQADVVQDIEKEVNAEEEEEAAQWFAFDLPTRLGLMLSYLRREYAYCFWCGCQYDSQEELSKECPGEAESDH